MTRNIDDPARLNGTTVIGGDGEKLGSVDAVYYDNATDRPEWVAVRGGLFGTRVALVPLRRANYADDTLHVPFDKVQLRNAPHHDPGRALSSSDEADLYRYYGIDYTQFADDAVATNEFATGTLRDRDGNNRTRRTARAAGGADTMVSEVGQARLRRGTDTPTVPMPVPMGQRRPVTHAISTDHGRVEPAVDVDDPGLRERRSL